MTRAPGHLFQRRKIDPAHVISVLEDIETSHLNKAWAAILGGSVLCLLSVLLLTGVYYLLAFGSIGGWGFKATYLIIGVLCLPGLFWLAHKLPGSILEATVPGSDLLQTRIVGRRVIPALVVAEMANIGPRLVLWGVYQVRGRSAFGAVPHQRVATAMIKLADADGGVSPAAVLEPGESADQLEPLLGVLLYHDLADMGKRADKVWITTDAKRKLGIPV